MTPQSEKLLAGLKSENADERYAAWVAAREADPEIIPELGKLLVSDKPGVRKAADEALKKIVHSVGREPAGKRRTQVVDALLALAASKQPKWTRTLALRHLSGVGGDESVAPAAKMLAEPEIQEEAVFCLERIAGAASDKALIAAYEQASDGFKPRILAALGHRRTEAAAALCVAAMGSSDRTLSLAGMKALGRIGAIPAGARPRLGDFESLSDWEKVEFADSLLRMADGLAERGAGEQATMLYRLALDRPEEHLQCAAIVGLSRVGGTAAKNFIREKTGSSQRNVRITAEKALRSL